MLTKIKDLMHIKESIDELKASFDTMKAESEHIKIKLASFDKSIQDIKDNFSDFQKNSENHIFTLNRTLKNIELTNEEFNKEILSFKTLKTQILNKITEKTDSEIKEPLERLKTDVNRYNNLKEDIAKTTSVISSLTDDINKFKNISSKIKEQDFQLTNFTNKIFQADREKLKLMEENENLKSIIAKQRRQEPQRQSRY